jgi:hypothetical protein
MAGIKLSETQITILSYFISYKINESTKQLIFKSGLLKHEYSYRNLLAKFKALGFIIKDDVKREYYVDENKFGSVTDELVAFYIKIDNQ